MLPRIAEIPYSQRFATRKPRIFIGLVAYGDISPEVMLSWAMWCMGLGARNGGRYEVYFGMATKREQYRARNYLVQQAAEVGADFLLMIDDDHTVHDCPEMLDHFFSLEKPIQTALSFKRTRDGLEPTVLRVDEVGRCDFLTMEELPRKPSPVDASGGGCTWVDMWVFDFLAQPFWWPYPEQEARVTFIPNPTWGLDIHFCIRAKKLLGLDTWLNTNVVLGHVVNERDIIRPAANWRDETKPVGMQAEDYAHREQWRNAYRHVADALCNNLDFRTVMDVGAAQGFLVDPLVTWGKDVYGVEIQEAARAYMSPAARERISVRDATEPDALGGEYDLVACVEVAEHIDPAKSDALLDNLTGAAGKWLYFTADETPSRFHINARPHEWWLDGLRRRGWVVDGEKTAAIREHIKHCGCPWLVGNSFILRRQDNG